jgi:hypothetical protein
VLHNSAFCPAIERHVSTHVDPLLSSRSDEIEGRKFLETMTHVVPNLSAPTLAHHDHSGSRPHTTRNRPNTPPHSHGQLVDLDENRMSYASLFKHLHPLFVHLPRLAHLRVGRHVRGSVRRGLGPSGVRAGVGLGGSDEGRGGRGDGIGCGGSCVLGWSVLNLHTWVQ